MAGREKGRACEQTLKYLNLPTTTHPLHEKPFLGSKFQMSKSSNVWCRGFHMFHMFVILWACEAKWLTYM